MKQQAFNFGTDKISKIIWSMAPPVMFAQLIQALYNIVDSLFVGRYSESGLTALSIIYPIQLLMIAFAVGSGVGINTCIAHYLGLADEDKAEHFGGIGTYLGIVLWAGFAIICFMFLPQYARMSTDSERIIREVVVYGRIVCVGSLGLFLESIWTKVLQAHGDMRTPMLAQIAGAVTNIVLDPILIFGMFHLPKMGIAGAAVATVFGQIVAALIVMRKAIRKPPKKTEYFSYIRKIYKMGIPNILMQSAYTFYIFGLNMILATFSDQAVTALGLYYKWQTFFFIPLGAMQTCIVPILSFNYASGKMERCKKTLSTAVLYGMALMMIGVLCFLFIPSEMLRVFSKDAEVIAIGTVGLRIIAISFLPLVTSLIFPVFFQAVGKAVSSSLLTIVRTVFLFVPLGYLFSRLGLHCFWITFPVTEIVTTIVGLILYRRFLRTET